MGVEIDSATRDRSIEITEPAARQRPAARSILLRYGSALGSVALAVLIRYLLTPHMAHRAHFLLLLPAILFSCWFGGFGPGVLAMVVGAILSALVFISPQGSLTAEEPGEVLALLMYILAGVVVILLSVSQKEAQQRAETNAAVAEQQRAEIAALNGRLKQTMIESNHRIKNNLQVVSAMLALYSADDSGNMGPDDIARLQQHINTLATLHDLLTQSAQQDTTAGTISMQTLLEKLVTILQKTAGTRTVSFHGADAPLSARQGTSLCLIVNELVSNSFKHGAERLEIVASVFGESIRIQVRDDGPGFPPDFNPVAAANTGLELVMSLAKNDLHGRAAFENLSDGGADVSVTFPARSDRSSPAPAAPMR